MDLINIDAGLAFATAMFSRRRAWRQATEMVEFKP
jgi:hypothetical protein